MRHVLLSSAVVALAAAPSFAQELTFGDFSYDFTRLDADEAEIDVGLLGADIEFTFDQFVFGAQVNHQDISSDGGPDFTFRTIAGYAAYAVTPEILFGAGLTNIDFDGDDIDGYEVFAQYRTGQYGAGLTYFVPDNDDDGFNFTTLVGEAEVTPGVTLGAIYEANSDADEDFYNLSVEYEDGPIFVRGYYTGVTEVDGSLVGVRGSYDVTDMISVSADYQKGDEDFFGDLTAFSLGAGYEFAEGFIFDAAVGRIEIGDEEADLVQVGVTYQFGERARLDQEMSDAIREDRKRGIGSFVPDVGFGFGL